MEQTNEKKEQGMLKPAMNHGLLVGGAVVLITLILYLTGQYFSTWGSWVKFFIIVGGLVYAQINYRNEHLGGYISYGQGLGYTVLVGLFTGLLTGVFLYALYGFISPDLIQQERQIAEMNVYRMFGNMGYDQQMSMIELQTRFITPLFKMIFEVFGKTFNGLIVGLIASIFIKKRNPDAFL